MDKNIAIVIPFYRKTLTKFERVSLRQVFNILNKYDFIFVTKDELDISECEAIAKQPHKVKYSVLRFSEKHFKSTRGYSKLLLSRKFYRSFQDYEYILIYQPDCFVFRDELEYWCDLGYDCIGSPVYKGFEYATPDAEFISVNGGLSLRKVASHLKVLNSFSYVFTLKELKKLYLNNTLKNRFLYFFKIIKNLTVSNNTFHLFNNYQEIGRAHV